MVDPIPQVSMPEQDDGPEPVDLGPVDTAPIRPPTQQVAQVRAQKASIGLSDATGQDANSIYGDIVSGKEPGFRAKAAAQLNFQAAMEREKSIVDAYKKKGSPLSAQEAINVLDPYNKYNTPANPEDVIERAYATSVSAALASADTYMKDTVYSQAQDEIPDELKNKQNVGENLTTKMELLKTWRDNNENEIAHQNYFSWGIDIAKTMLQPYDEVQMRGINPNVGKIGGGLFLGENVKAQAQADFLLPLDEFTKQVPEHIASIKNPQLRRQYIDALLGQSSDERMMNDIFSILGVTDAYAGGKVSVALLRKISVNNRAGTAFKQMVQAAAKPDTIDVPVKAVMKESIGDVDGAAATRASDKVDQMIHGNVDPVKDIKESITSNYRLDGDLIDSNPGNLSRDKLTILKDGFYESGNKLWNVIQTALKVNRTPVSLTNEDALRAYQDVEKRRYPGLDNSLLDVSSPQHQRETNTYWIAHTFGNLDGRLFSDPETAVNFMKQNGFADPRIVEDIGEVLKKPAKERGTYADLKRRQDLETLLPQLQGLMQSSKDYVSKKFIGPRLPESIDQVKEFMGGLKDTIAAHEKELSDVKGRITTTEPVIEQNGVGYKAVILRPYRETDPVVRQWLINDKNAVSSAGLNNWSSWKNSWLGWVRGADDTLSVNETIQRKVANYTQSVLRTWAKDEAKAIEDIAHRAKWYKPQTWFSAIGNKQAFEEFNQFLKFAKTDRDPVTGELGYFKKTPGEINDHYQRYYTRDATFPEIQAYFSHVKLLEGNRVLSEIAEFRNRARLGAEQHQIYTLAKDGSKVGSDYFDGIQQYEFPGGKEDQILIMGGHQGDEKLYHLGANEIPGKDIERYREFVRTGKAKVIRIYDPDSHPLKQFSDVAGDNRIRYIFVTDSDSKPLAFNHVNRRGGGHFDVDADWYVKQADMRAETIGDPLNDKRKVFKKTYVSDKTFMPIKNREMGRDIVETMNKINAHMKASEFDQAKVLAKKLGIDWDTMSGFYKPKTAANGKHLGPPSLDWDEPFYVVPRNKKIFDLNKDLETRHGDLWRDGTKSGSDAQQFQVAYNQARDSENLMTLNNEGTHANPIYRYVAADYVDPIPSLNRALNRAISSTFMDDYKIHAVEHWLSEAIPHLKASETEVRAAPFYYFNNADRGAFKPATETDQPGVIDNLLSNRFKIRQFTGLPNKVDTYIHGATQLLVDEFYKRGTPEWFQVVPLWALSRVANASALRSFAFNAKLGLFAIPQFLVQSQTFTNIWAISPRAAGGGTMAAMLHTWARINKHPAVIEAMDKKATQLGWFGHQWKPGWFKEANGELARTGFEHVGGEYMLADDQMQHNFFKNQFGRFLDAGQVFFREGEKSTRLGAYYTSFLEWRTANPTKVLEDVDRAAILQKADLLTNNMSRASASALNSSLLSLPTQFLSYQIRMAELFLGKRLGGTTSERVMARARLMGLFAAMYGAPSAIGVTGYPFGDSIREFAINHGYTVGDNQIEDLVMNGIPAWSMAMISGGGDYQRGTQYNVGNRYGSQGLTVLQQSMRSDATVWKLITGAAGSTIVNSITSFDPFWQMAKSLVGDDEEGNAFHLTPDHFESIFSEISSIDSWKRYIYAMHTGRWLSHNENYIENVTGLDALYRTLTGLRSQEQDDIWTLKNIKDQEETLQKEAEQQIVKDYHRGIQATQDGDDAMAKTYFTNARVRMIASGIPMDRRSEIMAAGSRGYEPQIETSVRNWAEKNVPYGEEATRLDAETRFLSRQQLRNQ